MPWSHGGQLTLADVWLPVVMQPRREHKTGPEPEDKRVSPDGRFIPAGLFLSCLLIGRPTRHAKAAKPLLPLLALGAAYFNVQ